MLSQEKFTIKDSAWENYPLWKYIKQELPHYTKILIIKELRLKNILVNGAKSYFQYKLQLGDLITVKALRRKNFVEKLDKRNKQQKLNLSSKEKLSLREQIIYENEHLFILNKKAGQFIQPDANSSLLSLQEKLQVIFSEASKNLKKSPLHREQDIITQKTSSKYLPKFVHRLDRSVSGLIIGAKTAFAHSLISEALKEGKIEKRYKAIVYGSFLQKHLKLENWLLERQKRVKVLSKQEKNSRLAITEIYLIANYKKYAYLDLILITGRKNQLRAQLSALGFPILGDRKYLTEKFKEQNKSLELNTDFFNQKKIALLSFKLSFPPYLIKALKLSKPSFQLPESSNFLLEFLRKDGGKEEIFKAKSF